MELEDPNDMYHISKYVDGSKKEAFSTVGFRARLTRNLFSYMLGTYLPAALMVVVSWISYLVAQDQVVGRLALLVMLTLIEINLMNSNDRKVIKTGKAMAVEIYTLVCMLIISLGIVEYNIILYLRSSMRKRTKKLLKLESEDSDDDSKEESVEQTKSEKSKKKSEASQTKLTKDDKGKSGQDKANQRSSNEMTDKEEEKDEEQGHFDTKKIDVWAGILFPAAFLLFNIAYWSYYGYQRMKD